MFVVKVLVNFLIFFGFYNLVKSSNDYEDFVCLHVREVDHTSVCPHGAYLNSCPDRKLQCYKGLDEHCGVTPEKEILQGKCAPELLCCNSKCTGCRLGECSQSNCQIEILHGHNQHSTMRGYNSKLFNDFRFNEK